MEEKERNCRISYLKSSNHFLDTSIYERKEWAHEEYQLGKRVSKPAKSSGQFLLIGASRTKQAIRNEQWIDHELKNTGIFGIREPEGYLWSIEAAYHRKSKNGASLLIISQPKYWDGSKTGRAQILDACFRYSIWDCFFEWTNWSIKRKLRSRRSWNKKQYVGDIANETSSNRSLEKNWEKSSSSDPNLKIFQTSS